MNTICTSPRLMPLTQKSQQTMRRLSQSSPSKPPIFRRAMSAILALFAVTTLAGCAQRTVVVQPCPELPPPPASLMKPPPTLDLVPLDKRPNSSKPVSSSKPTPQ